MKCENCGFELINDEEFCGNCGTERNKEIFGKKMVYKISV